MVVTFTTCCVKKARISRAKNRSDLYMFSRVHRFILYSGFFLLLNAAAFGSSDTNRGPGEVLIIEHPQATHTFTPQRPHVKEMVRTGLLRFTGKSSTKQAWLSI